MYIAGVSTRQGTLQLAIDQEMVAMNSPLLGDFIHALEYVKFLCHN